jgi:hypothetical protein
MHTPGPWTYSDQRMPDDDARGWWVEGPASAFVAQTLTEADARLIAAAPDLLAALKHIQTHLRARPLSPANWIFDEVDRAIAEAEA